MCSGEPRLVLFCWDGPAQGHERDECSSGKSSAGEHRRENVRHDEGDAHQSENNPSIHIPDRYRDERRRGGRDESRNGDSCSRHAERDVQFLGDVCQQPDRDEFVRDQGECSEGYRRDPYPAGQARLLAMFGRTCAGQGWVSRP